MGVFSWDCNHCGHPLIDPCIAEDKNRWMGRGVVLLKNGDMFKGEYDGYGRINDADFWEDGDFEVFHEECWKHIGKPLEFTKASRSSADQGHFYADGVHNSPPPGEEGYFHADEKRPRKKCTACGSMNTRQRDAIKFECEDCGKLIMPPLPEDAKAELEKE